MAFTLNLAGMACPSQESINGIKSNVTKALNKLGVNNPDIRAKPCQAPDSVLSMLIWSTGPKDSRDSQARDAAPVPDEISGKTFAVFVTKGLLSGLATAQFNTNPALKVVPGFPSVHLTDLSVGFSAPNSVEIYIKGYDDRPTPDVHFTTTITDQLLFRSETATDPGCSPLTDPNCGCQTSSKNDISGLDEIIAAVTGYVGTGLGAGNLGTLLSIRIDANDVDTLLN
jgi:hypothetical protein